MQKPYTSFLMPEFLPVQRFVAHIRVLITAKGVKKSQVLDSVNTEKTTSSGIFHTAIPGPGKAFFRRMSNLKHHRPESWTKPAQNSCSQAAARFLFARQLKVLPGQSNVGYLTKKRILCANLRIGVTKIDNYRKKSCATPLARQPSIQSEKRFEQPQTGRLLPLASAVFAHQQNHHRYAHKMKMDSDDCP